MTVVNTGKIESVHPQSPKRATVHELDEPTNEQKNVLDEPMTWSNWHKHVHWIQATLLVVTPFIALYGALNVPLQMKTFVWSFLYYFFTGWGITAGYHRLWSHRSYTASRPFQLFLLCGASGAVQGSLRWWCRNHRAHHRYTDTDDDPYGAHKGLFWSHIGWMLVKQNPKRVGRVDISDLNADWLIRFQHRWYVTLVLTFGLVLPMSVAGLGWGDWRGGFFFAAVARLVAVHHATFCVNSLAHYLGDTPFDDKHTPRDHFITAFMTLGEGYHNFHHEFPQDYRNAIRFYQYDPTKWLIRFSALFGLVSQLKMFPENEVRKGILLMKQKGLDKEKARLDWGTPISQLPVLTFEEFEEKAQTQSLILIEGVVHDVTDFMDEHPGGRGYLKSGVGRDMTTAFNGGVYNHSNAAHNLMSQFRVAVVSGGGEVESRKMNGQHHVKFE